MTIWLLAVILLASLAGLGYRQGGIRVAFSFVAIVVGAFLAVPLGRPFGRLLGLVGVKDPLLIWALGPILVFIIISVIFKVAAAAVHHKVDVYYKYHSGDLRLALWERLNHRLGLCLGVLNGAAYLILLAFLIYLPSYLTYQLATSDSDPKWMRLINRMGEDLHSTGFAKVARAIDRVPDTDFQMADLAGLIYRNPLLEARLGNYPGFLGLGESPEFQGLGNDKELMQMWAGSEPIMNLLGAPRVQAIRQNPELLRSIWNTVLPDLQDVSAYLKSGLSAKYDPIAILGRWKFDPSAALNAIRRGKPNISSLEMQRLRRFFEAAFGKTELVARPDAQISLKNAPALKLSPIAASAPVAGPGGVPVAPPLPPVQSMQGQWKDGSGGKYLLTISNQDLPATVENDRLSMKSDGMEWVFSRED
ncbi:MAG TPA: CvpA family protein [Verrucomicrobiae bacterium]|nr:CvpA family protein [Verrucomicrobiae bacterium]